MSTTSVRSESYILNVPQVSKELRAECKEKGVTGVFSALDGVISAGLATASVKSDQNITIITINDDLWKQHIPYAEDPISKEPVFQRQVVGTQIVEGTIPRDEDSVVKTVGGRSFVIKHANGVKTVNDVSIKEIISVGGNEVWVLDKLLFIRPEDIELGAGRVRGDVR